MRRVLIASLLVSACASTPAAAPRQWDATVRGNPGTENVRASVRANSGSGQTAVSINLAGGSSGGSHPWHVHVGTCASRGAIVGVAAAYPVLLPDGAGNATAIARLAVELAPGQSYNVNVHESPQNMGKIISCGNLN